MNGAYLFPIADDNFGMDTRSLLSDLHFNLQLPHFKNSILHLTSS